MSILPTPRMDAASLKPLSVQLIALAVPAFVLPVDYHMNTAAFTAAQWRYLLGLIEQYQALPLVSQNGHLEGLLQENHFLKPGLANLYQQKPVHFSAEAITALFAQAHRDQVSLDTRQQLADAQILLYKTQLPLIPILNEDGCYTGFCASRKALLEFVDGQMKPERIGGMATPLGVYMTSGVHSSGAGWPGLLLTGALFAVLLNALDWLYLVFYSAVFAVIPELFTGGPAVSGIIETTLMYGFLLGALLLLVRLTPMSALHAAEHMTINAIESGLPLTSEHIRTQPRVHQRCGTNLMVYLSGIQLGISYLMVLRPHISLWGELIMMAVWAGVLWRFGRQAGTWLQTHVTTKIPSEAQLASGIKAGEQLLAKFRQSPHGSPTWYQRLWGAGLLQLLGAFLAVHGLISWFTLLLSK